jgi:hypothetical protein
VSEAALESHDLVPAQSRSSIASGSGPVSRLAVVPVPWQSKPSPATIGQCLVERGYTLWTSYQPASRFWTFRRIEAGWLLALSVLLIAATVWVAHRRPA